MSGAPEPHGFTLEPEQERMVRSAARGLLFLIRTFQPSRLSAVEVTQATISCACAALLQAAVEPADADVEVVLLAAGMGIGGLLGQLGPHGDASARIVIRGLALGVEAVTPPDRRADA